MGENFFVFKKINKFQIEDLLTLWDPIRIKSLLKEIFKLYPSENILLDFHENNLEFCKSESYSLEQASALLGILDQVLIESMEKLASDSDARNTLETLLKAHSIQRAPYSIQVFSEEEIRKIWKFVEKSLFRHYDLYKYALTPHNDIVLTTVTRFEGTFPALLPLTEGEEVNPHDIESLEGILEELAREETSNEEKEEEVKQSDSEDEDNPVIANLNKEIKIVKESIGGKLAGSELLSKIEELKFKEGRIIV